MRKEPYTVGSYTHVFNRGHRKSLIVIDVSDYWNFLKGLFYFNDQESFPNWKKDSKVSSKKAFYRPNHWPPRKKLTEIFAYCLMPNHLHLCLLEIIEGGISKFMQKLGTGMSNYYNTKYQEKGSIFQNSYRSKTIDTDNYLKYLMVYILVKNPFDLFPSGYSKSKNNFNEAYEWAENYAFCGLGEYTSKRNLNILNPTLLNQLFDTPESFKIFARDCIEKETWKIAQFIEV